MLDQFSYMEVDWLTFISWSIAMGLVTVFIMFTLVAGWFILFVQLSCIGDILKMTCKENLMMKVSDKENH